MKRTISLAVVTLGLVSLIQGCALEPQKLHLEPTIEVKGGQVASDTLIGLSVTDARASKKLGEVGDPDRKMVDVTLEENFAPALYDRLVEALAQRGFKAVPESAAMTRSLTVEVKSLVLSSVKTPFNFQTELRAEVGAAGHNATERYDRLYYVRSYKETAGPPFEKDSNTLVNTAVSQALEEFLADDKLFEMLSR